jgi:hypothetical protein
MGQLIGAAAVAPRSAVAARTRPGGMTPDGDRGSRAHTDRQDMASGDRSGQTRL